MIVAPCPPFRSAPPHPPTSPPSPASTPMRWHGTASFELEPPDEAEMTRRMRALLDGGFPYLVAEIDGALAGYAYAGPYRPRPAYRFSVEDSIYVDPERAAPRRRPRAARAPDRRMRARGFRQMIAVIGDWRRRRRSNCTARRASADRRGRERRLQVRPLARHRADAARARAGRDNLSAAVAPVEPATTPPPASDPCRARAARGRAHGRAGRSGRSPRSRCRRPAGAPACGFFSMR